MNQLKYAYLLPIGSVIRVKGTDKKWMIFGILQKCSHPADHIFDYVAVPYPEGLHDYRLNIGVNHSDIEEVVFRGFEDKERAAFLLLLEAAERRHQKMAGSEQGANTEA